MSGDYSSRNRRMLKRFLPYYKKYSGLFALDMFCSALTTVCEIALPLIVRQITDRAAHDIHDLTAELIIKIVGFYILLRIIDTAASYYTASGGHIMGARIETDMRNDLFSHLQDMSYSFYDDTKIGQLMSRITNDLFDITELAHHGPENVLMTVIKIIAGFIMFASMNIWLAIIVFSLMPLMMLLTSHSRRKMRAGGKADGGYLVFYNMPLLRPFAYERQRLFGIGKGHFEILALAHGIAQDESVISVHGERHGYRLSLAVGAHIVSAAGNNQNRRAVGHIRHFF